jgi:hypothetical protein
MGITGSGAVVQSSQLAELKGRGVWQHKSIKLKSLIMALSKV